MFARICNMACCLLGPDRSIEGFSVGKGACKVWGGRRNGPPIRVFYITEILAVTEKGSKPTAVKHEVVYLFGGTGEDGFQCCFRIMFAVSTTGALCWFMVSWNANRSAADFALSARSCSCDSRRWLARDGSRARRSSGERKCRHDGVGITQAPDVHHDVVDSVTGDERCKGVPSIGGGDTDGVRDH